LGSVSAVTTPMIARAIETSISVKPAVEDVARAVPRVAVALRRGLAALSIRVVQSIIVRFPAGAFVRRFGPLVSRWPLESSGPAARALPGRGIASAVPSEIVSANHRSD
jgi:hypothetical protein